MFQIILLITSLIHYTSVWRNSQRNLQIKLPISFLVKTHYKTSVQISGSLSYSTELIHTIPTVYILPLYLFWKARSGTCRIIVYTLLLVSLLELENVLYIVRKVFSVRFQRIRDRANWIVGSRDIQGASLEKGFRRNQLGDWSLYLRKRH